MNVEEFGNGLRSLAQSWLEASENGGPAAARKVLDAVLADGLAASAAPAPEVDADDLVALEIALIRASGSMDAKAYAAAFPRAVKGPEQSIEHFCTLGWQRLHNPFLGFDVWWYTTEHLGPEWHEINPLLHYLLAGRHAGLATMPTKPVLEHPQPLAAAPRRAVLFAGYDKDGLVDDYVVAYLTELARHADVYYLADCTMQPGELEKLEGIVQKAWAERHGRYDFGSYSRLARELVGWDRLAAYDEVVFANDAAYLLRPLDDVFAQMNATACDAWGLQLTARFDGEGPDKGPIPLDRALAEMTPAAVWHYDLFPHLGSYFFAVRQRVVADAGFRKHLNEVSAQDEKLMIVYKYETGTTYRLAQSGFQLAAYVDELYPYHPVYSPTAFTLIGSGFPVIKRALIAENPYDTPDLYRWKERIAALVPDAPVDMLERNLLRVAPDDRLQRSLAVRTAPDGSVEVPTPLTRPQMRRADAATPTFSHWWAFPVCAYDHTFAGNERAVFEEVRNDPSIKKIVLTRSRRVEVTGENVVVLPIDSPEGQQAVLRAGTIFVKHGARANVPYPLSPETHNFINLWHGIPLKRFGWPMVGAAEEKREALATQNLASRAVITSSKVDTLTMTAAFHPLQIDDMWPTGLPRNDFTVRADDLLPADLRAQADRLRAEVAGRRLVMFLPTFKDGQADAYYRFTEPEIARLRDWADRHNAVIGVREHMADKARTYSTMLAPLNTIDLSSQRYPDLEVLYRVADALISDYSSCLVDFQLTGRPVISFAYDYEHYANVERGLFYDLDAVLPGPVCRDFDALAVALEQIFETPSAAASADYARRRSLFFDHIDDRNAARVVERVRRMNLGEL